MVLVFLYGGRKGLYRRENLIISLTPLYTRESRCFGGPFPQCGESDYRSFFERTKKKDRYGESDKAYWMGCRNTIKLIDEGGVWRSL